jgi:hypothetical protein
MLTRIRRAAAAAILVLPAWCFVTSTPAGAVVGLTHYVDCVAYDPQSQVYVAYFGFDNTSTAQFTLPVGDTNYVYPGSAYAGQPTEFDPGNYPRVFSVEFDNYYITSVVWSLDGVDVAASASSPSCTAGTTAPASDVTTDGATLNGVVEPEGLDTTYRFEYGTTPSLGESTDTRDAGAGTRPVLVQETLAGLMPSTTYYFRLDTTNSFATATGDVATFTTAPK